MGTVLHACLPASRAAMAMGAWDEIGVTTWMASISFTLSMSSNRVKRRSTLNMSPTFLRFSSLRWQIA